MLKFKKSMSNTEHQDCKKKPQTNNLPARFVLFSLETNLALTADLELAVAARSKHWLYYPLVDNIIYSDKNLYTQISHCQRLGQLEVL